MNEKNIGALANLIAEYRVECKKTPTLDLAWPEGCEGQVSAEWLARFLASRGVLAPTTLTFANPSSLPTQDDFYHGHLDQPYRCEEYRSAVTDALERIARGEP